MAMIKVFKIAKNLSSIFSNLQIKGVSNIRSVSNICCLLPNVFLSSSQSLYNVRTLCTTTSRRNLMEFFDDEKNWCENEVKVGRAWNKDELRIKSNRELHQLWYILLKERNMLLTMEHECKEKVELFPSPERLDKVNISMNNLETVVRERNRAYHLLETGETGERPSRMVANPLGINYMYRYREHVLPPHVNMKYCRKPPIGYGGRAVRKFLLLYREKLYNEKRKAMNRARNEVTMLLRRNPNLDKEMLHRRFPNIDIDKLLRANKTRGHFVPKIED